MSEKLKTDCCAEARASKTLKGPTNDGMTNPGTVGKLIPKVFKLTVSLRFLNRAVHRGQKRRLGLPGLFLRLLDGFHRQGHPRASFRRQRDFHRSLEAQLDDVLRNRVRRNSPCASRERNARSTSGVPHAIDPYPFPSSASGCGAGTRNPAATNATTRSINAWRSDTVAQTAAHIRQAPATSSSCAPSRLP